MDIPERRASNSSALHDQDVEGSLKIYRQVFNLCDKDGNGFVTKEELAQICEQASDGTANGVLDNVMQCLKPNHEGHISFDEFKSGFQSFQRLHDPELDSLTGMVTSTPSKLPSDHGNGSSSGLEEVFESEPALDEIEAAWRDVADRLDPVGALATTGVKDMWKDLYSKDPSLLENFEGFLLEILMELKQSDVEKTTLEQHIRKITEQHSREVSEMDHLLQEELRQARTNQEQNNASKTYRLSSHYNSLLEQREAVIGDMISQETDLKHALQHKTLTESQLKEDKKILHSENLDLREQLNSSHSTTPQHGSSDLGAESTSDASLITTGLETEPSLPSMTRLIMPTPPNLLESDGSGYSLVHSQTEIVSVGSGNGMESGQPHLDQELAGAIQEPAATNPELSFRLNVIQEDQEEDDIKYYPERGSAAESADHPKANQDVSHGELKLNGSYNATPTESKLSGYKTPPLGTPPSEPGTPSSVKAVTITHSSVQSGQQNLDTLTYSGVMPRREDMPRPSPPELATITRVFKVIFLGDAGVGKTSLIARLTEGQFKTSVVSTVGLDFTTKTLRVGEERVMFQLWDTAGQERFKSALTPVYFRRADAFVIVYDVADRNTFKSIKKWISILKAALREQPPVVMLVGNKSDKVEEDRQVLLEEGRLLAVELQAMFSETSALSGDNVLQAHSTLAQLLLARENADLRELKKRSLAARQEQKSKCSC